MDSFVCDLGFSSAKWYHKGGQGRIHSAFRWISGHLHVGDDALTKTGESYLKTPEELVKMYPDFVRCCLDAAGVEDEIALGVGLPFNYWDDAQGSKPHYLGRTGICQCQGITWLVEEGGN